MRTTAALSALALGLTLGLTACGADTEATPAATSSETSTSDHNDADVRFASGMVQHHAQALAMVDTTVGRDLDPEVVALADDIRAAQTPEIETMADWLTAWGEEVPETVRDHANAHSGGHGEDHGGAGDTGDTGADMPGMMSGEDMEALADAGDAAFQDLWLEMMIEHHEGAVAMAAAEGADGRYRPALRLAEEIQAGQTAEIEQMQALLS